MKKVYLHFKEFELGFLTKKDGNFIWVPNVEIINLCFKKYDSIIDLFFLDSNEATVYNKIPYHFEEFLIGAQRGDLIKRANIKESDDDFEKLCKMATLKYANQDFFIKI